MASYRFPDALPPLKGWAVTIFVAIWCVLLVAAIAGPIGAAAIMSRPDPILMLGIDWRTSGATTAGAITAGNVFGHDAQTSGVHAGDVLLSLDGVPIVGDSAVLHHLGINGRPAQLTVQSPGAAARTVRLTYRAANVAAFFAGSGLTPRSAGWWSVTPFLLAAAFQIFVAILLFQRRRDPVAALLSAGILGLTATSGVAHAFWEAIGWGTVITAALAPARMALYTGLLTFPSGRFEPRWVWFAMLALLVAVAVPPGYMPEAVSIGLILLVVVSIVTALVWRFLRDRKADGARQWRWAILGFVSGIALIVIFLMVLQPLILGLSLRSRLIAAWQPVILGLIYLVAFICLFGGLALSVLRYRLYDTQAAVSRSILYGVLTLALLGIFAGSEKIVEVLGEEYFGESMGALAGGLGAAFAAVAIGPLHHRIAHWAEHRFRKNLIHLRRDLPPLLIELGETANPVAVARAALDHLAHGLHAVRGAVVADGNVLATHHVAADAITSEPAEVVPGLIGELQLQRRDPLFPVRLRLTADGGSVLLVGPRPDDSLYDRQERDLLADLAGPLAQALRISADRTMREATIAARFAALELTLASLREDLHRRPSAP